MISCPSGDQQVSSKSVPSRKYATVSQLISGHIRHSVLYLSVAFSNVRLSSSEALPQYGRSSVSIAEHQRMTSQTSVCLTTSSIFSHIVLCDIAPCFTFQPQAIAHDLGAPGPTCHVEGLVEVIGKLIRTKRAWTGLAFRANVCGSANVWLEICLSPGS
jgi:hypothetical protein